VPCSPGMRALSAQVVFCLLLYHDVQIASSCTTDDDCQLNGVCIKHTCVCDDEWHSENCGQLSVGIGTFAYSPPNTSAWGGGPPVYDPLKKEWVLFVTEMANHCGLSVWRTQSQIVKAVATNPKGPYSHDKVVIPTQAHNPFYAQAPDGTHLIYHIGDGDNPPSPTNPFINCSNGTTPATQYTNSHIASNSESLPIYSQQPHIHYSKSLDGPFRQVNISLPPGHSVLWGADNPAPFIFDNGTVLMLTRKYNGTAHKMHIEPHDTIWLVRAPSFKGPYELVLNRPIFVNESFNEEDPFLWMDHRGHFHALFHFTRGHAWSQDGVNWSWGGGKAAWTTQIRMADGEVQALKDTERPRLWINPKTRRPELLFVASGGDRQPSTPGDPASFLVVQPIGVRGFV